MTRFGYRGSLSAFQIREIRGQRLKQDGRRLAPTSRPKTGSASGHKIVRNVTETWPSQWLSSASAPRSASGGWGDNEVARATARVASRPATSISGPVVGWSEGVPCRRISGGPCLLYFGHGSSTTPSWMNNPSLSAPTHSRTTLSPSKCMIVTTHSSTGRPVGSRPK